MWEATAAWMSGKIVNNDMLSDGAERPHRMSESCLSR